MGSIIEIRCDLCGYNNEFMLGMGMESSNSIGLYYANDKLIPLFESNEKSKNYEKIDFNDEPMDGPIRCPKCKNISLKMHIKGCWD